MTFLSRRPKNFKQFLKYTQSREMWESALVMLLANIALLVLTVLSFGLLSLYQQVLAYNSRILTAEPFYLIVFLFMFSALVWFVLGLHQAVHIRKNKIVTGFWVTLISVLPLVGLVFLVEPVVNFTESKILNQLPYYTAAVLVFEFIFYAAGLQLRKRKWWRLWPR